MSEVPILFTTGMVQAILTGRKTQTRRILNPQPGVDNIRWDEYQGIWMGDFYGGVMGTGPLFDPNKLPKYMVGDLLYVRETWAARLEYDDCPPVGIHETYGGGGMRPQPVWYKVYGEPDGYGSDVRGRWRPNIHMPKWMSRIWLKITALDIERVQSISNDEAFAEGIEQAFLPQALLHKKDAPRIMFRQLWDSINGCRNDRNGVPCNWTSNPWVWKIEFERVER